MNRSPAYQNFTCVSGGRTTITLIRISRGPGPFTGHPTSNIAGIFPSNLPTPGYMRQCRLTPHPARALLAPALTDGDTHPLHPSPSIQCCNRQADSLVGRRILPLARRQRKVKDDDGPFKGMVTIQSLAEDAGLPLDRVLRQAGGD